VPRSRQRDPPRGPYECSLQLNIRLPSIGLPAPNARVPVVWTNKYMGHGIVTDQQRGGDEMPSASGRSSPDLWRSYHAPLPQRVGVDLRADSRTMNPRTRGGDEKPDHAQRRFFPRLSARSSLPRGSEDEARQHSEAEVSKSEIDSAARRYGEVCLIGLSALVCELHGGLSRPVRTCVVLPFADEFFF